MARFRVGDRVRIVGSTNLHGKTATVYEVRRWRPKWNEHALRHGIKRWETAYLVDVDGIGRGEPGSLYGFPAFMLRPAVDPRAAKFIADMERFASLSGLRVLSRSDLDNVRGAG